MLEHIWTATRALGASTIVLAGTWSLGRGVLAILGAGAKRLPLPATCVIGVCVYGTVFTALSLLDAAHAWLIAAIGVAPIAFRCTDFRVSRNEMQIGVRREISNRRIANLLLAICLVYLLYVLVLCLGNYYGADLLVYHLTIPRDVLDHHGFEFNPYWMAAGLPLGWHHFGLFALVLGGERGYLALSFWAFVGVLSLSYSLLKQKAEPFPSLSGFLGAAVVAYVVAGMSRGSLSNNDVPLMLLEGTALLLAVQDFELGWFPRSVIVGLVAGFAVSVKTQSLVFLPILCLALYFGTRERRLAPLLLFGAVATPIALVWPLNTLLHTGSPLPLVTNSLHLWGEPLPHLADSLAYSAKHYGLWYEANFARFFTQGMIGLPLLMAGLPTALLCCTSHRRDPLVLVLTAFAVVRYASLSLGTMDPQIVYHDRYHLISYACLGLAAISGWLRLGTEGLALEQRQWQRTLGLALSVLCTIELAYPVTMWSPQRESMTLLDREVHPSMLNEMMEVLRAPRKTYGTDWNSVWAFVERNTSTESTIATTSVITYGYRRRFISLLPNTQDGIDLTAPPEEILHTLKGLGVNFIHLAPFSSQNGFMEPFFERALASTRRLAELPDVRLVYEESLDRLFYVGDPGAAAERADVLGYVEGRVLAESVGQFAAERRGLTRIVLSWTPEPFADCEIELSTDGKLFRSVGVVPRAARRFVLRDVSPDLNYVFRVRKKWGGAVSEWRVVGAGPVGNGGNSGG